MANKIKCDGRRDRGQPCGAYLGEVVDGKLRIYCRTCKTHHDLYITDLIVELEGLIGRGQQVNQFLASLAHGENITGSDKTA